jgi:hypothetical protein
MLDAVISSHISRHFNEGPNGQAEQMPCSVLKAGLVGQNDGQDGVECSEYYGCWKRWIVEIDVVRIAGHV